MFGRLPGLTFPQQLGQFGDIRRDPSRLILAEQLGPRPKLVETPSHLSEVPL
jgi:hypothetical protein